MKKSHSILGAAVLVSSFTVLSKLLGFGREALIAAYYGATAETDAFFFAHGMPSMIFPAVGNSISFALTSLYVKRLTQEGEESGDRFASRMLAAGCVIGIVLGVIGLLLTPLLVPLLAPGFSGAQRTLAIHLTRLIMGAFVFNILQYMLSAVLNSKKHFVGAQLSSLFYNIVIIAATVMFGSRQSMDVLMLSVIGGMALQVVMLAVCYSRCAHFTPLLNPIHPDTALLLKLSLPILLGNSVVQLNNIVDKALGSLLPEGSLSALNYANNLTGIVTGTIIISLSTVLYPSLTEQAAKGDTETFSKTLERSLGGLTAFMLPVSCITVLDASEIVTIVYARGSFDQTAVAYTAIALACYAPIFLFSGAREILARGFFAVQDTKTPMLNSAIGVACNAVFSIAFVWRLGIAGIALGTAVASAVIAVLMVVQARNRLSFRIRPLLTALARQLLSGGVLVALLLIFHRYTAISSPLLRFAADTVLGFLLYGAALSALGGREVLDILNLVRKKG